MIFSERCGVRRLEPSVSTLNETFVAKSFRVEYRVVVLLIGLLPFDQSQPVRDDRRKLCQEGASYLVWELLPQSIQWHGDRSVRLGTQWARGGTSDDMKSLLALNPEEECSDQRAADTNMLIAAKRRWIPESSQPQSRYKRPLGMQPDWEISTVQRAT